MSSTDMTLSALAPGANSVKWQFIPNIHNKNVSLLLQWLYKGCPCCSSGSTRDVPVAPVALTGMFLYTDFNGTIHTSPGFLAHEVMQMCLELALAVGSSDGPDLMMARL